MRGEHGHEIIGFVVSVRADCWFESGDADTVLWFDAEDEIAPFMFEKDMDMKDVVVHPVVRGAGT
jgi:hypothetical protein